MAQLKRDKSEWISSRNVLWILVFTGFAVNYMVRINLNIAIVSMIKARPKNNLTITSKCIQEIHNLNSSNKFENKTDFQSTLIPPIEENVFEWTEYQQGLVLGAFFWLHWLTQVPGGILAQHIGTKLVFGLSNYGGVLCGFFIPLASNLGPNYLCALRVVQGLITGFSWPAMHHMTAKWIPPNERSKFVSSYLGSSLGAALTFPMCGYLIHAWGWEIVFYVSGFLGSIWYIGWLYFVYDSPQEHPRITKFERDYIQQSLGQSVSNKKKPVPWKELLLSKPVWINILAQWGGIWGLFTLMTHAPTYFKVIHGWNIKATGILSGIPHFMRMVVALVFSQFGDYLLRSNKMSRTNLRKLATAVCCIGQGFCMLALAYTGCNYLAAIIFLTSATAIHGAVSTGPLASFVDLSPNYASITLGLSGMITVLPGFISPVIVGILTNNNQTVDQWQKVFWIAAGMLISSGALYVIFAKSELQPWNSPDKMLDEKCAVESELKSLRKEEIDEDTCKKEKCESEKSDIDKNI